MCSKNRFNASQQDENVLGLLLLNALLMAVSHWSHDASLACTGSTLGTIHSKVCAVKKIGTFEFSCWDIKSGPSSNSYVLILPKTWNCSSCSKEGNRYNNQGVVTHRLCKIRLLGRRIAEPGPKYWKNVVMGNQNTSECTKDRVRTRIPS